MTELTLTEAAKRLGVAASTLRHQVNAGRLRARMAGKTYLVAPEEIERYRAQSRGRAGRPARLAPRSTGVLGERPVEAGALEGLAERWGIRTLSLFGSVARGDARPDSDVDIVIELEPDSAVGLLEHAQIAAELEPLFGRSVDLVTWSSLRPRFRDSVAREAVTIVAR